MTLGELHRESGIAKGYLSELVNENEGSRRKPAAETLYAIGTVSAPRSQTCSEKHDQPRKCPLGRPVWRST